MAGDDMSKEKYIPWDVTEYLTDDEMIIEYLRAARHARRRSCAELSSYKFAPNPLAVQPEQVVGCKRFIRCNYCGCHGHTTFADSSYSKPSW